MQNFNNYKNNKKKAKRDGHKSKVKNHPKVVIAL